MGFLGTLKLLHNGMLCDKRVPLTTVGVERPQTDPKRALAAIGGKDESCPEAVIAVIAVAYLRYPTNLGLSVNRLSMVCLLTGSSAVCADWVVAARKRVLIDRRL